MASTENKLVLYTNYTCTCMLGPNNSISPALPFSQGHPPPQGPPFPTPNLLLPHHPMSTARLSQVPNPGSNRADVCLAELGISFEERIINVDGPRPADFMALNPRGLVPVLIFNDQIIIESGIVCQFLCDIYPSHLCPPPTTTEGALKRAKMSYFIDAYWTKFHTILFRLFEAPTKEDEERIIDDAIIGIKKEVEPLLADASPFWGGSDKFTLAEVLMSPFVIRAVMLSRNGVYPTSLNKRMEVETPTFHKWVLATSSHPSITRVVEEDVIVKRSVAKRQRMRAAVGLD